MTNNKRLSGALAYMNATRAILDQITVTQTTAIDAAAAAVVSTLEQDGLIYLFGTGHSHMMAEEGHYRAGGLGAVCPILSSGLMLHESAAASTAIERTRGMGPAVLSSYDLSERDTIFIFSNSGVNAAPVETALAAAETGATVVAIVSADYAATVPPRIDGKKLTDVADIVIDNKGVPGDSLVAVGESGLRTGPASTVSGAFILNAVLTEAIWRMAESGQTPPIYISANMPGAMEHNETLVARFRREIRIFKFVDVKK